MDASLKRKEDVRQTRRGATEGVWDVPQPLAPAVPRFGGAGEAQVAGRRVSSQEQGVKSNDAKR